MFAPSPSRTTRRTNNRCVSVRTTGEANTTGASQHQADVRLSSPIAFHLEFTSATHLSAFCPSHKHSQSQLCKRPLSDVSRLSHTIISRPSDLPSCLPVSPFSPFFFSSSLPLELLLRLLFPTRLRRRSCSLPIQSYPSTFTFHPRSENRHGSSFPQPPPKPSKHAKARRQSRR